MKFEINGNVWGIKEISSADMDYKFEVNGFTHGITIYSEHMIYLNIESPDILRTLKHELMHVWLYEYGHNQDNRDFNYEDVCEIVASSNDFINMIVDKYKQEIKQNG